MHNTQTIFDYSNKDTEFRRDKKPQFIEVKSNESIYPEIEWRDFEKWTHDKIPVFSFAPLDEIRKDFLKAGFPKEEIKSMIVGLSQLPEYANSKRSKKSKRKN